jgi:hypothetical protein
VRTFSGIVYGGMFGVFLGSAAGVASGYAILGGLVLGAIVGGVWTSRREEGRRVPLFTEAPTTREELAEDAADTFWTGVYLWSPLLVLLSVAVLITETGRSATFVALVVISALLLVSGRLTAPGRLSVVLWRNGLLAVLLTVVYVLSELV